MDTVALSITLDNRELAVVIWFVAFMAWAAKNHATRTALWSFLKAIFCWPVLSVLGSALAWTAIGVSILAAIGFWTPETLKTTVLWYVAISFGTMLDVSKLETEKHYLRNTIKDAINMTVLVTFAIGIYASATPWL